MKNPNYDDGKSPFPDPVLHITSHNATGQAVVRSSTTEVALPYEGLNISHSLLYTTAEFPADLNNDKDIKLHEEMKSSGKLNIVLPHGTVIRIVNFGPHNTALMHRTQSLDYGVVLEGSIIMELDDGSKTLMNKGDTAIQRGTMHAWKNASETEWARMLFVLQDCQPLTIEGQRFKEDLGHGYSVFPKSGNDS
jgi:quercetin dioxygenase-like cupin family protein